MRSERVIVVFVASPSDLEAERARLEDVVRKLNITWSKNFAARLELVRWETHAFPGIGSDPQDVINQQIPNDFDIFIGLMWGRFGTPTGRAQSGTEEEFQRALSKYKRDPDNTRVMFYFKDTPLPPSKVVPAQLEAIQKFKCGLGDLGTLYWEFDSLEQFEDLIGLHLARQLQFFMNLQHHSHSEEMSGPSDSISDQQIPEEEAASDLGLIDLMELAERYFEDVNQSALRIAEETHELGKRIQERTKEIAEVNKLAPGKLLQQAARAVMEKTAADLNLFVRRVRSELPSFDESLRKGVDASTRAALIQVDMSRPNPTGVTGALSLLNTFAATIATTCEHVSSFKEMIKAMPKMASILNRARRDTVEVLDEIVSTMLKGRGLMLEAAKSIESTVEPSSDPA